MEPKEPKKNEKLKDLVKVLANAINSVFTESEEIKDALRGIEDEGYRVDLILASITRILRKDNASDDKPLVYEFNNFDKAFLKALKINIDPESNKD